MVRPFLSSDTEAILETWYAASKTAHPFLEESFLEQEYKNIRNLYLPNTLTWVYITAEELVGFISMIGNEIGAIFIHPDFHKKGIGTKLVNFVSERFEQLEVDVFEKNVIGRAFYEK